MSADAPRHNLHGGAWLLADMSLNIWALSIIKWLGAGYPTTQLVFLRALTGFVLLLPVIWRQRASFHKINDPALHVLRVGLSVVTLTASFFAIARVPFALFTAISFTRPVVTMIMAALVLREVIGVKRWIAAGIALLGVILAANPREAPWSLGLAALAIVVVTGSAAIIVTRRLREAAPIVLMTFYTAGIAAATAPFAFSTWAPISPSHLWALLLVGVFSQVAQFCFLRAHYHGEAGFLSVLSYFSLVLSVTVGYFVFSELPGVQFAWGAGLVIVAAALVTLDARQRQD
ncbi:MAG: DMT family transporter [Pseudomonadota bacterium]